MYVDPLTMVGLYAPVAVAIGMLYASLTDRVGALLRVSGAVISALALIFVLGRIWFDVLGPPWSNDVRTALAHFSAVFFAAQLMWLVMAMVERYHNQRYTPTVGPPSN